jgi:hypothetical protein
VSTQGRRSRADELLGLEFGDAPDFDDPRHEWRDASVAPPDDPLGGST